MSLKRSLIPVKQDVLKLFPYTFIWHPSLLRTFCSFPTSLCIHFISPLVIHYKEELGCCAQTSLLQHYPKLSVSSECRFNSSCLLTCSGFLRTPAHGQLQLTALSAGGLGLERAGESLSLRPSSPATPQLY